MDTHSPRTGDPAPRDQLLATLAGLLAIQATDVRSALNQASDLVVATLSADKVDVFVNDPAVDTLVAMGTSHTPMGRRQAALGLDRLPLGNGGCAAEVFHRGVPYRSGHVAQDPEELRDIKEALGVQSALMVALDVDGVRRGVVQVDSAEPERFTEEDVAFLQAVAHWVALIMHRAELVERVTQEAAEQARQRTATELITMLAHDLRVPLTPLQGYLGMLQETAAREGQDKYLQYATRAQHSVTRLERMLTDLLDTTRLDQGLFALTLAPVNLAALVQDTADLLQTPTAPIEVRVPGDLITVADATRLRQVLENLLSNALRYSPDRIPVIVEMTTEHHVDTTSVVITVQDAGPGIAPDLLPRLFTRFVSGGGNRRLGLGLYLARGIAVAHGGTLTADSRPGKGACFRLALPLAERQP
jgi:signal transduction histidine kinase